MQIDALIPFKSSTHQAMTSLYFLRILISFYYFYTVKSAAIITGYALLAPKKTYFRCLANSFIINPLELFSTSYTFSSLLLDFSPLFSFRISTVSFNSTLAFRYSASSSSIYWKFIIFSFIEF